MRFNVKLALIFLLSAGCLAQLKSPANTTPHKQGLRQVIHDCGYDWPEEEVKWIIYPEERDAFKQLKNDDERGNFIELFWYRRDPTPDTYENEFRNDYYSRIRTANQQFGTNTREGWKTDRGRIFVVYGKPDSITTLADGREEWEYRYMDGVGSDIKIDFRDVCHCGDFRLQMSATTKDALLTPNGLLPGDARLKTGQPGLQVYVGGATHPSIQFRDLEEIVAHRVELKDLNPRLSTEFHGVTQRTVQVDLKFYVPANQLQWKSIDGVQSARLRLHGRWTTMVGKIPEILEKEIEFRDTDIDRSTNEVVILINSYIFSGRYRVEAVLQDVNSEKMGTLGSGIIVPNLSGWCD